MKKKPVRAITPAPKPAPPTENDLRIGRLQGALGHYLQISRQINLQPGSSLQLLERQYYDDLAQLAAQVGVALPTWEQVVAQAEAQQLAAQGKV